MSLRDPRYNPRKLLLAATASDTCNEEQRKLLVEYRGIHSFLQEELRCVEQLEAFSSSDSGAFKSLTYSAQLEIHQKIAKHHSSIRDMENQLMALAQTEQLQPVIEAVYRRVCAEDVAAIRVERREQIKREAEQAAARYRAQRAKAPAQKELATPVQAVSAGSTQKLDQSTPAKKQKGCFVILQAILVSVVVLSLLSAFVAPLSSLLRSNSSKQQSNVSVESTELPETHPYPLVYAADRSMILKPEFECICPFDVSVDSLAQQTNDFYVFLEYVCPFPYGQDPDKVERAVESGREYSSDYDTRIYTGSSSNKRPSANGNVGVFISMSSSFSVDVPPGCYRLWYCSGESWYGLGHFFGDDTVWHTSDDILTFYYDSEYVYGQTITLKLVEDGNFDTYIAKDSELPDFLK